MPALALLLALAGMWVMAGLAPATKSAGGAEQQKPAPGGDTYLPEFLK